MSGEYDWRDLARLALADNDGTAGAPAPMPCRRCGRAVADPSGCPECGGELFAVALVGDCSIDGGWLVTASGAEEAKRIVHGTVPRAHECAFGELLVWSERFYRERFLMGDDFPSSWTLLDEATP